MTSRDANGLAFLGLFRFVLATSVVMFHLWTPVAPDAGRHAVVGFFLISGFLIPKITREGYRGRPVAFAANRFLRIYPQYAVAVLVCIVTVKAFPGVASGGYLSSLMPSTLNDWLAQLTISTLGGWQPLLPPLWSLNTELYFYLFIGLLTHDSLKLTLACSGVSLVVAALSLFKLIGYTFYVSAQSDAFMFFAGSLAYFWASRFIMPRAFLVPAFASYAITMYVVPHCIPIEAYAGSVPHACLLISAACTFVILVILQQWPVRQGRWTAVSTYLLAMRFDLSDPARETRRTDTAFWLHLLAAPLIVHSLVRGFLPGFPNAPTTTAAVSVLGIFVLLGAVAVVIDRRAILVSGLVYAGIAFGSLIRPLAEGNMGLLVPMVLFSLGAFILLLSAGWQPLRRALLRLLPADLANRLPHPTVAFTS